MPNLPRVALGAALTLLLAGCTVGSRLPLAGPDGPIAWEAFDGPRLAREIAAEANRVRSTHGVPPLSYSTDLCAAADEQALHLEMMNGVSHLNPVPGEETADERVHRAGVEPAVLAENVLMEPAAAGATPPVTYQAFAARLVAAWMDSPGHRANLLDPVFTHTGCAARLGHTPHPGSDRVYAVQEFVLPATRSATVRPRGLP